MEYPVNLELARQRIMMHNFHYSDILYAVPEPGTLVLKGKKGEELFRSPVLSGGRRTLSVALPHGTTLGGCVLEAPTGFVILEEHNRRDYFDYFGLYEKHGLDARIRNDSRYLEQMASIRSDIKFFVSYKCPYKCPYCWQRSATSPYARYHERFFDAITLAEHFNRIQPGLLTFTGGEPTLYDDLFFMTGLLDEGIQCKLISNLGPSFNVGAFSRHTPEKHFQSLVFSYHPSETSEGAFLEKLDLVLQKNFESVLVVFVLYEEEMRAIESMVRKLKNRNVGVRLSRCTLPGGCEYRLSEANESRALRLIDEASALNALQKQLPATTSELRAPKGIILCPTGHRNFHVEPDGKVYACMSALGRSKLFGAWALPHYQPIGNILDVNFTYLEKPVLCWESFRCSACDYTLLQDAWKLVDETILPLPE
jgi:MoaA/NifB/PqqE/SkfB family radical SAM enzyme